VKRSRWYTVSSWFVPSWFAPIASTAVAFAAAAIMAVFLAVSCRAAEPASAAAPDGLTYPLNVFQDDAHFTLYVNEDPVVRSQSKWMPDGSFSGDYSISMAGQTISSSLAITVDERGYWTAMSIETPQGPVEVVREGGQAKITHAAETETVELRPGTRIFENFSPSLMSQAVVAYDQAAGGKQIFPLFIIPAVVMDASLERLETVERTVAGRTQNFTLYRYGLPGVDVTIWVDDANRVCFGDVPAQHAAYVRDGYETLRLAETADSTLSQPTYEVTLDDDVAVAMRDGVKLSVDIYRPEASGKFPVILVRTPYKKEMSELQAKYFARRGYVYAAQDCRGRFASGGKWEPFFNEPADGYDTIEWLAAQPWSNGKVGMIGGSYVGWVQWWAAREAPPHLVTIIPNVSPPDPYYNIPYEYGAFFLFGAIWWADVLEQEATADLSGKSLQDIMDKKYARLLRHLPVIDLDEIVLGKPNPYWRDWIKHPDNDAYWDRASFLERLAKVDIPVYHQSGWYDGDGIGSKLNYLTMTKYGHANQKLVLGPWGHTASATRMGPRITDFGPSAIVDLERSYVRWLDRWLKGIDNGIDREPLVAVFAMGSNKWLTGNTYPLAETQFTKFYLASQGKANTSSGDGWLEASPPADGMAFDTFTYDPGDPTPDPGFYFDPKDLVEDAGKQADSAVKGAEGGEDRGEGNGQPGAPGEEVSVEEERARMLGYYAKVDSDRSDILVYDTRPWEEPLTLVGPVSAVLYAGSSAKDTDWFMRLSQVDADGGVFPLVHGVIRARYRNSFSKPEMLTPGEIYEYHLDMWQTGITVPAGARLRVEVCSASFPMFSRNLNTGGHNETETKYVSAVQRIYHDKDHPSHVLLPVIPVPDFKDRVD